MNSLAANLGMEYVQFLKQPHVCVWRICFGRLCHTCGVAMHEEKSDDQLWGIGKSKNMCCSQNCLSIAHIGVTR